MKLVLVRKKGTERRRILFPSVYARDENMELRIICFAAACHKFRLRVENGRWTFHKKESK